MPKAWACSWAVVSALLVACGGGGSDTAAANGSPDAAGLSDATTSLDSTMAAPDTGTATGTDRDTGTGTGITDAGSAPEAEASTSTSTGDAAACGTRTGMRGLTHRSVSVDGGTRTYLIYLPANMSATAPMPFVYVFHGYTMSGQEMYDITQYAALADSEGIALAFPDGDSGPDSVLLPTWNVENPGQTVCGAGQAATGTANDFGFMDAMKADVSQDQCIDDAHVFATGFSMGGYFSHHIGCYKPGVRAIAPGSGGTIDDLSACTTGNVPAIIFHGTADPLISPGCDDPNAVPVAGFPASATLWAKKNGCESTYTTIPTDSDAGGDGQCYLYDGCPDGGQVELCTFTGMGHAWAGGDPDGGNGLYVAPTYASATQLEWSFFKQYAW
jgi:polyhydroxybutyrate depolymerase